MRNFNTVCAHLYVYVLLNVNPPLLLTFLRHHISCISLSSQSYLGGASLNSLKKIFFSLDMNGDEILNAFEFRHVMTGDKSSFHLESAKLTHQECDTLFNYLDNDKSGGISWDEFRNFISRYQ